MLACALDLLGRTVNLPPVQLVDAPPSEVSRFSEAFTRPGSDTIYLITSTEVFRRVQRAQPRCSDYDSVRKLASILVHEAWHVHHGPDERGAYEAQLTTLAALGAGMQTPTYDHVVRSMNRVLEAQRKATPPISLQANQAPRRTPEP
ncbi:MAG: hypothetical protein C5B57_07315 [Blastocatellia bacterium]|nr:MAG: hypothetical protein C5B57_07315 [Blastocatellia bacterium]